MMSSNQDPSGPDRSPSDEAPEASTPDQNRPPTESTPPVSSTAEVNEENPQADPAEQAAASAAAASGGATSAARATSGSAFGAGGDDSSGSGGKRKPGRCKRALKATGLVLAIPGVAVVAGGGYVAYKSLTSRPDNSPEHEESKAEYLASHAGTTDSGEAPNVLLVYYDDMGYGDLGFTGDTAIKTPNIDALAEDGVIMSNYHAPSAVCTPSRAAMLTGRVAPRADVPDVLFPTGKPMSILNKVAGTFGLTQAEMTIPDVLKASGYETGMIGKWHIGDTEGSKPNDFGFDSFLGSLYSNDMEPFQIYRDEEVVMETVDQTKLDALYTDEAVEFIGDAAETDDPFFLYFAHNFPHEPLFAAEENEGRSDAGLYGDVVEGLDDGIGRIVDQLEATGQLDNTVIMITSDNGPWYQGDPGDHRGRKGSVGEGGTRVPFLVHWPDGIEGGRTLDTMTMGTDLLPTLMDWLDIEEPTDRALDGASMASVLDGTSEQAAEYYYFYAGRKLIAVSDGRFKYYTQHPYIYATSDMSFTAAQKKGPWLFDLQKDSSESYDVSDKYPEVVEELAAELERRNEEMAENPRGWVTQQ